MEEDQLLRDPVTGPHQRPAKAPQFIAGIISCIGPFVFGYCLGGWNGTIDLLLLVYIVLIDNY